MAKKVINTKEEFLKEYESQWDYAHIYYERGLLLEFFIRENAPDYAWMFDKPQPVHISAIPAVIRDRYIDYIKKHLVEYSGFETIDEFTIDYCIKEYGETVIKWPE